VFGQSADTTTYMIICNISSLYVLPAQVSHDEHLWHIRLWRFESSYTEIDSTAASTWTSTQWICIGESALSLLNVVTEIEMLYADVLKVSYVQVAWVVGQWDLASESASVRWS